MRRSDVFEMRAGGPPAHVVIELAPGGHVKGRVLDSLGHPAEKAFVMFRDESRAFSVWTRADETGRFEVRDLPEGDLRVRASLGERKADAAACVRTGTAVELELVLGD
jgi:hypothetical protein